MMRGLWVGLAMGLALTTACGDDDDSQGAGGTAGAAGTTAGAAGSGGDTAAGGAGAAGSAGATTESLAAIQADIFNVSCSFSSCHSPEGKHGNLVLGKSDVVTSTSVHAALVGVTADIDKSLVRVRPGDPDNSFLMMKLHAASGGFKVTKCDEQTTVCGDPMPQGAPALEASQIARIERWITQGALDN